MCHPCRTVVADSSRWQASVRWRARCRTSSSDGDRSISRRGRTSRTPFKAPGEERASDYRIAWFDNAGRVECGDETRTTLGALIQRLESAGVKCENRPFDPSWLDQAYAVWGQLYGTMLGQDAPWLVRQVLKSWHVMVSCLGRRALNDAKRRAQARDGVKPWWSSSGSGSACSRSMPHRSRNILHPAKP